MKPKEHKLEFINFNSLIDYNKDSQLKVPHRIYILFNLFKN